MKRKNMKRYQENNGIRTQMNPDSINPLDYTLTSYYPKTGPQLFRKINLEKEIGLNIVNFQSDYEEDEDPCEEEIPALEENFLKVHYNKVT